MQADHAEVMRYLRTARGQIDGIMKMVDEDRYCIDVSNQLMATEKLISKINGIVLNAHIEHCVRAAAESGSESERDEKLAEIKAVVEKLTR